MKLRKAWYVVWSDGTAWRVDCLRDIAAHRKAGIHRIVPIRVMGPKWPCGSCELNMRHG